MTGNELANGQEQKILNAVNHNTIIKGSNLENIRSVNI